MQILSIAPLKVQINYHKGAVTKTDKCLIGTSLVKILMKYYQSYERTNSPL